MRTGPKFDRTGLHRNKRCAYLNPTCVSRRVACTTSGRIILFIRGRTTVRKRVGQVTPMVVADQAWQPSEWKVTVRALPELVRSHRVLSLRTWGVCFNPVAYCFRHASAIIVPLICRFPNALYRSQQRHRKVLLRRPPTQGNC